MSQQKAVEAQAENAEDVVDELAPGTKLLRGQYTIVRYLNSGGFGITYLAKDSLDRNVVIKECFPSSYCRRSKTVVAARSRAHTAELRSVVQLFVREARNLAKIVHPNIVAVHQVFEDNFTAYMAIDFIDGLDLQEVIEGKGHQLGPQEIVSITEKLLDAVGFIHEHDMLHRDISPDNVLIDKVGEPILIDFGAARDEASQKNRAMSALRVVKDGYSPQEFYIAGSEQGPWSDLYALGATLYHVICGDAPTNGQARLAALAEGRPDPYVPLEGRFSGYPPGFLKAIDKAMQTLPAQRVQSASEWLSMFHSGGAAGAGAEGAVRALLAEHAAKSPTPSTPASHDDIEAPMIHGDDLSGDEGFGSPPEYSNQASSLGAGAASSGRSGGPMIAIGAVLLLAALGGGYMMMGGKEDPPAVEATTATTEVTTETTASATSTATSVSTETATDSSATAEATSAPTATTPEQTEAVPADEPATTNSDETVETAAPTETTAAAASASEAPDTTSSIPAPAGAPTPNQITFAAWDADVPFVEENRIVDGVRVAVVSRISPSANLSVVGDWLKPGLMLYTVNGRDIQEDGSLTAALLNAMKVDPDGKARVVVEYSAGSTDRESGLLTVDTFRLISLANGVTLLAFVEDGKWKTVVSGVVSPEKTELHQGDILFREKTTGIAIDSAEAVETALAKLVEAQSTLTTFSIIRDGKVITAAMQLAVGP